MDTKRSTSMRTQSIRRIAISAWGLVILLPTVAIVFLLWGELADKWAPLLFIFAIANLGFVLLWMILGAITRISRGLEHIAHGDLESIPVEQDVGQLAEMTEIINALNKLTADFQTNAAQLETLIQHFSTLTELTELTARIPDINELLELVLQKAMGATRAKRGSVMLVREGGDGWDVVATEGWTPSVSGPINLHDSLAGSVFETGEPLRIENLDEEPEIGRENDSRRYSSPSCLIMPLKTKLATIGVVCLSEKGRSQTFSPQDQQFLTVLLGQIGFAVENAQLLRQARHAANALTDVVAHKDVELKDAQDQIVQSDKLSALGQLIAGVAHEMNNPLTSIVGYSGLVIEASDKNTDKIADRLETIQSEAHRATRIVQNLLSFARDNRSEKKAMNVGDIVANIVSLREYDLKTRDIELTGELDPNLPPTVVDADQIQQVLLNLVNNAAQAMKGEGERKIRIGSGLEGDWILLWVQDTGKGISEENKRKIFEPFFSTKKTDTNTGLGLSISSGIIKEHGGEIEVESVEGEGTKMILRLPIVAAVEKEMREESSEPRSYPKVEGMRAFVIDDEPPIVELVTEILEWVGYEVECSTKPREALESLKGGEFDLVICDIRMPEINGKDLFLEAKKENPKLANRFILTSGDIADPQVRLFANTHKVPLVAKPFNKERLLDAVFKAREPNPS